MTRENSTRPSRQASGRVHESNDIVSQRDGSAVGGLLLLLSVPFLTIVVPRLMYMVIAPMKGWC